MADDEKKKDEPAEQPKPSDSTEPTNPPAKDEQARPKGGRTIIYDGRGSHVASDWEIENARVAARRKQKLCTEKCPNHKGWCNRPAGHTNGHYCDECFPGP